MAGAFVPGRGDFLRLLSDPAEGHEQAGARPWLVLTPAPFNLRRKLIIACAVISRDSGYAAQVPIPPETGLTRARNRFPFARGRQFQ